MEKEAIRAKIKAQRKNLTKEEIEEKSDKISSLLFSSGILATAKTVMVYIASFNEVRTDKIIATLLDEDKKVCAPITDKENISLVPCYVTDLSELRKGAYGILEPCPVFGAAKDDIDAVIVPGIAFDKNGNRMGFGAGYYDRFLESFCGTKIGICYDFQLVDSIPRNEHDIPMDYIVSEENLYAI